jgi:O-antigen/teichoic acid export membrane protein
MASDRLFRHSLPMHVANLTVLLVNALYHRLISSGMSAGEYGVLQALSSGVGLLVLPFTAVSSGLTHFMSRRLQAGRAADARALFHLWLFRLSCMGLVVLAVGWVFSPEVAAYFHFNRREPVVMATLVVAATLVGSVAGAPHAATQSFYWLSGMMIIQAIGRLVLAVCLIRWVFPTAGWALLGTALAIGISLMVGLVSARSVLPQTSEKQTGDLRAPVVRYVAWSVPFLLAYTALFSSDTMVIRRLFPGDDAGYYAQIANLARIAVFIPLPFCRVLFPKVSSGGTVNDAQRLTWLKAVGATLFLMLGVVGFTLLFPHLITSIIFPKLVLDSRWMNVLYALLAAMFGNGLLHVLLYFETAQHRFASLSPILIALAMYLGGISYFSHDLIRAVCRRDHPGAIIVAGLEKACHSIPFLQCPPCAIKFDEASSTTGLAGSNKGPTSVPGWRRENLLRLLI